MACWVACGCSGSSSSSANSSGTATSSGLQFTSPLTSPTIELNPAGTASINLTVSQSASWGLQSATGFGKPPAGAALSATTGTTATLAFNGILERCNAGPAEVNVVATTSAPPQTAILLVSIAQSPPCLSAPEIAVGPQHYTSCPPAGTIINSPPAGYLGRVGTFFDQQQIALGASGTVPYGVPPFTWNLSGSLPAGLFLGPGNDTSSMILSGTPTSAGCFTFQLQVTDSQGGVSCDPTITTSCEPTTFSVAIIPAALKIQLPAYSDSFDGIPYSPLALSASGGMPPYTWIQPSTAATLPPGLTLSAAASNSYAVISGTPQAGDSGTSNGAGNGPGSYPTSVQVNDNQSPYPAVGTLNLNWNDYMPTTACAPAPSSPQYVQPFPGINGGLLGDGAVLADNYFQGSYAFQLRGFDARQPTVISGSMTLDGNGNVTAGEEDITQGTNSSQALAVTGGAYTVGVVSSAGPVSYSRGCVTLRTAAGIQTFDFTLSGCTNQYSEGGAIATSDNACGMTQTGSENVAAGKFSSGRIIESDDGTGNSAQLSGFLRAQNTSSFAGGLNGPFAFGLGGWDVAGGHYAMAGFTKAGAAIFGSATADVNDAGQFSPALTGGSGSLSSADSNGRITATLAFGQISFDLVMYMVSPGEALVATTDPLSAGHPILGGEALASASSFDSASVQFSQMLAMDGLASVGPDASVGILNFDGVSAVSGTVYENQAGTVGTTSVSGAYSVDPMTGRTTFIASLDATVGPHPFIAYLIPPPPGLTRGNCSNPASCVTGFIVSTDSTAQDGLLEFQTSAINQAPFTNRLVAGDFAYASTENLDWMTTSFEGDVYGTPSSANLNSGSLGASSLPFYQDSSYGCLLSTCPLFIPGETLAGSYTINPNGTGTFGGGTIVSVTNGSVTFYLDESPVNLHPSVAIAEQ
ncbi:MAG: hypothetical protein WBX38_07665 [Candidatus Sulfotelmatobacter sp.]